MKPSFEVSGVRIGYISNGTFYHIKKQGILKLNIVISDIKGLERGHIDECLVNQASSRTSNPVEVGNARLGRFDSYTPPPFYKIRQYGAVQKTSTIQ